MLGLLYICTVQSVGRREEWEGKNSPPYYVPGLPRVVKKMLQKYHIFTNNFVCESCQKVARTFFAISF